MTERCVLAIESSCDETAAAVVEGRSVLSSVVASQYDLHERFGGVVPEIASRRHLEVIDSVVQAALNDAGVSDVDAIAVTQGPGLIGALLVGVGYAKGLAAGWNKPLVPVDHLLGHIASACIGDDGAEPPFLCLLASGGHTMIVDVAEDLTLTRLATTLDDAAGEAFDKAARLLGLDQPGGPSIERAAASAADSTSSVSITPAMVHHQTADMSFSGMKTALSVHVTEANELDVAAAAAAFQDAAVSTLTASVKKVLKRGDYSRLAVVGGVAANLELRSQLAPICRDFDVDLYPADLRYCGDNAAMIGVAANMLGSVATDSVSLLDAYPASALSRHGVLQPTTSM